MGSGIRDGDRWIRLGQGSEAAQGPVGESVGVGGSPGIVRTAPFLPRHAGMSTKVAFVGVAILVLGVANSSAAQEHVGIL